MAPDQIREWTVARWKPNRRVIAVQYLPSTAVRLSGTSVTRRQDGRGSPGKILLRSDDDNLRYRIRDSGRDDRGIVIPNRERDDLVVGLRMPASRRPGDRCHSLSRARIQAGRMLRFKKRGSKDIGGPPYHHGPLARTKCLHRVTLVVYHKEAARVRRT